MKSILIEGMNCGHCTGSVQKALSALPGVTNVNVDLASKTATLEAAPSVSDDAMKNAVEAQGFKVVKIS